MNDITALLVEMVAGAIFFEMATLLRNSCLVSSMLFNCEAWYRLTIKQTRVLEKIDEKNDEKGSGMFIKNTYSHNVFGTRMASVKVQSLVKEVDCLKYILDQKETSLIKQVFNEQKLKPKIHDWVKRVENDFKKLQINISYEEISSMSKFVFSM